VGKEKREEEKFTCPVGSFFKELQRGSKKRSKFQEHINLSSIEFLKAFRSLLDDRIEKMEKGLRPKDERKATRIRVES